MGFWKSDRANEARDQVESAVRDFHATDPSDADEVARTAKRYRESLDTYREVLSSPDEQR